MMLNGSLVRLLASLPARGLRYGVGCGGPGDDDDDDDELPIGDPPDEEDGDDDPDDDEDEDSLQVRGLQSGRSTMRVDATSG